MTDLEYEKKMLESVLELNHNIDSFGKSFGEGIKKLDEQADDMLKQITKSKNEVRKICYFFGILKKHMMENK